MATAGDTVGPWRLVEPLGRGGNADVWRATRGQEVIALKILRKQSAASEPYARFRQEIEALRRLTDVDGILPLLDSHLPLRPTRTNPAWLATPVATPMLDALGAATSLGVIAAAVADIADALTAAAAAGVFHRDVKPNNLYELDGRFCVGDFGLAAFPDREALTRDGRKLGPMWYLAPEMLASATTAEPGPADVYSLAKTLWVLASGQNYPFPGEMTSSSLRLTNYSGDDHAHLLDYLILRCCAHAPESRPTMPEVARELQAFTRIDRDSSHVAHAADPALVARFELLRRNLDANIQDSQERRAEVATLEKRLEAVARDLATPASTMTRMEAEFQRDNQVHTLRPDDVEGLRLGSWAGVISIRIPSPPEVRNTLFFGGFAVVFTAPREASVTAAFGTRSPDRPLAARVCRGTLGTAEFELKLDALCNWTTETLPVALTKLAEWLENPDEDRGVPSL